MIRKFFAFILFVLIGVGAVNAQTPEPNVEKDGIRRAFAWSFEGDGGYLGVQTIEVSRDNLSKFGLREVKGVGVESVVEGSPAQTAGLMKGDVIVKVNGEDVTSTRKLTRLIGEISPDHQAKLTVLRNGGERDVDVTVGKRPGIRFDNGAFQMAVPMDRFEFPQMPDLPNLQRLPRAEMGPLSAPMFRSFGSRRQIGASVSPLTKQLAVHFGVDGGALVSNVREDSPAAKAGIKAGDIIVEADGKAVKSDLDIIRTLADKKEGSVTLTIVRDRNRQTVTVTPEEVKGGFDNHFEFSTPGIPQSPGVFKMERPTPPTPVAPVTLNNLFIPGRVI